MNTHFSLRDKDTVGVSLIYDACFHKGKSDISKKWISCWAIDRVLGLAKAFHKITVYIIVYISFML